MRGILGILGEGYVLILGQFKVIFTHPNQIPNWNQNHSHFSLVSLTTPKKRTQNGFVPIEEEEDQDFSRTSVSRISIKNLQVFVKVWRIFTLGTLSPRGSSKFGFQCSWKA